METVFQDRLLEFYETLAFHYARGRFQPVGLHTGFLLDSVR
jgi:hypothetical protein